MTNKPRSSRLSTALVIAIMLFPGNSFAAELKVSSQIQESQGFKAEILGSRESSVQNLIKGKNEGVQGLLGSAQQSKQPFGAKEIIISAGDIHFNQTGDVIVLSSSVNLHPTVKLDLKNSDTVEFGNTIFGGALASYDRDSAPGSWAQVMNIAIGMAEQLAAASTAPEEKKILRNLVMNLKIKYRQTLHVESGSGFDLVKVSIIGGMIQVTAPYPGPFNGGYFTYNRQSGIVSEGHEQYAGNFPVSVELLNRMISQVEKAISLETNIAERRELRRVLNILNHDALRL